MSFQCSKCGFCCRSVGLLIESAKQIVVKTPLQAEVAAFPFGYNKSGKCEKLTDNNECSVYDTRPDICNVEKFHKKYYADQYTQEEYFKINERACDFLKQINIKT